MTIQQFSPSLSGSKLSERAVGVPDAGLPLYLGFPPTQGRDKGLERRTAGFVTIHNCVPLSLPATGTSKPPPLGGGLLVTWLLQR